MKRLLTLLAISALIICIVPAEADAAPLEWFSINIENKTSITFPNIKERTKPELPKVEPPKSPKPVVYLVIEGDNLTKIGTAYNVEWQRLWAKNTQLTSPDVIDVGDKITIPEQSEQLRRDIPATVALPAATPGVVAAKPVYDGSNTYDYGYCTWYVKNRRGASIPNGLGNANTWYSRAAGMGMAVGSTPKPGAVGTTSSGALGHVVYVERVNGNGTINVSEMNAPVWGSVTYRTVVASKFHYIY